MTEPSCAGRGARLQATYLEAKAKEKAQANASNGFQSPMGRGAQIAMLLRERDNPPMGRGRVRNSPQAPAPTVAIGRGATVLESFFQEHSNKSKINGMSSIASKDPAEPSSSKTPISSPMNKAMAQLNLKEERSPVVQRGQAGQKIYMTANYIRLNLAYKCGVFEYEVRFDPDIDGIDVRFKLLHSITSVIGHTKTFDGVTLYLPKEVSQSNTFTKTKHPIAGTPVTIELRFRCKKEMKDNVHLYNVLFKRIASEMKLARIGRQHFDPNNSRLIPQHKLEIWPGYVTAVDELEGGLLLCCDSSSRVLRSQTCLEIIYDVASSDVRSWQEEIKKQLLDQCVLTRYNNRMYRIENIDFDMNLMSTFPLRNGGETTFLDYYEKHHGVKINDVKQPMLLSKIKKRVKGQEEVEVQVVLVPELCYLTGITSDMRSDFRLMKDIAAYTRITPNQRHFALKNYLNAVSKSEKATQMLADWGLSLDTDTVELDGRVADQEVIYFGGESKWNPNSTADWSRDLSKSRVFHAVDLHKWAVVYADKDRRCAEFFRELMMKIGAPMGIHIVEPQMHKIPNDRTDSYLKALREVVRPSLQLVVIIFPTARDDRYAAVKRFCCAENPIASQVINSKTLGRQDKARGIVQKIALQINCKVGGSLWSISNPFKGIMVVGIDTYHDSVNRGRSVGGFVASLNPTLTKWFSKVCYQGINQELVDEATCCFVEALHRYNRVNGKYPDRVIVYRDGVGDGQLSSVLNHEVEQFRSSLKLVDEDYDPKFSYVIVQKRINTKLFAVANKGQLENPPPGTVMDHTITRKYLYDFFLVSQCVRQGTVSPTHYIVLYDNSNLKPDHIQRFSYKLCHMYYNWSGTIRVPAPCQYAHRVAQLVGLHVRKTPHEDLSERLFFL